MNASEAFARLQRLQLPVLDTADAAAALQQSAFAASKTLEQAADGAKLATGEKALFDLAYLSGGRSRLFAAVPELEIPSKFRWRELRRWIGRIPSARGRTLVTRRLEQFVGGELRG